MKLNPGEESQSVWCLVNEETGMLDFSGQSQIASVPVFESRDDAEAEMDNYELDEHGYTIREATLVFAPRCQHIPSNPDVMQTVCTECGKEIFLDVEAEVWKEQA